MAPPPQSLDDDEVTVETRELSPSHFLLKIDSFSLLSENGANKFESSEFEAGDCKWRLIIYPNGHESGNKDGDFVSVFLTVADPSPQPTRWEINVVVGIFLHNRKYDNFLCKRGKTRRFHAVNPAWGFSTFISKKILTHPSNGYLVDDTCAFGAEVFVTKSQGSIDCIPSKITAKSTFERSWKISPFSESEDEWNSEKFLVGNHNWMLKVYPRGWKSVVGQSMSIFMHFLKPEHISQDIKVSCTIRMDDQINDKHVSRTCNVSWGWADFMSIEDVNDPSRGFVVDDCCIIGIEISVLAMGCMKVYMS